MQINNETLDGDEEDVVINESGEEQVADKSKEKTKAAEAEEDDDLIVEDEDERPSKQKASEEDDLTDEQRRELRRNRKKRQKERLRLARDNDKRLISGLQNSLAEANTRLARLEGKGAEDDVAKVDQALRNANKRVELLKAEIKRATDAGDNDAMVAGIDALTDTKADIGKIEELKNRMSTEAKKEKSSKREEDDNDTGSKAGSGDVDPALVHQTIANNVRVFTAKNPWYVMSDDDDDAEPDELKDSERVRELDRELAAEGSNPAFAAHWQELEARVREELPHRFTRKRTASNGHDEEAKVTDRNNGRRPAMNGGGSRSSGGSGDGKQGYVLSKQRVEAMKMAGIWEDPVRKKKAIDAYKKFDKENPSGARN